MRNRVAAETKRILMKQFGRSESDAHWMAYNSQFKDSRDEQQCALAQQQALANLEKSK